MKLSSSFIGVPLLLCGASMAAAQGPVDPLPAGSASTPALQCENAVTTAIQKSRGVLAKQVQFATPKRAVRPASAASEPVESIFQGEGRYQGGGGNIPFTYSCTFDAQSQDVTGVIFKDTGAPDRPTEKPWQADLANLSPEACEAGAATAVREQFPRAVQVALSPKSRQLSAAPNGRTYLHGQGSMARAQGMPPTAFTYRCELETASGKLLGVRLDLVE